MFITKIPGHGAARSLFFFTLAVMVFFAWPALAQDGGAAGAGGVIVDLINKIGIPIIGVLVPMAVAGIKYIIPLIPGWLLPILAGLIGPALAYLTTFMAGVDLPAWGIALVGLIGIGIREIVDQFKKAAT